MAKKPARLDKKACEPATMDHPHMMKGIQTSAPSFLLTRPLGSSAERKLTRKIYAGQRFSFFTWSSRTRGLDLLFVRS